MPKDAILPRLFYVTVNLAAVGNTTIIDAISGKRFIPLKSWFQCVTAGSGDPAISIGTNSAPFDNVAPAQAPDFEGMGNNFVHELLLGTNLIATSRWREVSISSLPLVARVSVAGTGTFTGTLYVMGLVL